MTISICISSTNSRSYNFIGEQIFTGNYFSVDEEQEMSISQVAESLVRAFDFKGKVVYDTSAADGQYKKTANNAKLRKHLPDFRFTPFERAIKETVDWYIENYDRARN